jgi:hypothetical protein
MKGEGSRARRKDMPAPKAIREFWAYKLLALGKMCDTENILDPVTGSSSGQDYWQCFCCGRTGPLDRAHIVPLGKGGDNSMANLHMLCRPCHVESEPLQGEAYWRWFLAKPFLSFMQPDLYPHVWAALGARDIHHAAELAVARFGTDPAVFSEAVKTLLRETYGHN